VAVGAVGAVGAADVAGFAVLCFPLVLGSGPGLGRWSYSHVCFLPLMKFTCNHYHTRSRRHLLCLIQATRFVYSPR
jgi:hypothetical protein